MSNEIAEKWLRAKEKAKAANEELLEVEQQVLSSLEIKPTMFGAHKVDDLRITCAENRVWDQDYLNDIYPEFVPEMWPFERVWKENKLELANLGRDDPEGHDFILRGLITKPKKPSFTHKSLSKK